MWSNLTMDVKGNKKGFYRYVSDKGKVGKMWIQFSIRWGLDDTQHGKVFRY